MISFVVSLQISLTFCKSFVLLSTLHTFTFPSMQLYRRELTAITWQFSLPYNNQHSILFINFSFTCQIRLDLIAIFRLSLSFFFHCGLFQQQVSLICAFVASLLFHNLYNTILIIIHPEACFLVVYAANSAILIFNAVSLHFSPFDVTSCSLGKVIILLLDKAGFFRFSS